MRTHPFELRHLAALKKMFYKGLTKHTLIIVHLKFFVFILDLGTIIEMTSEELHADLRCGLIRPRLLSSVGR